MRLSRYGGSPRPSIERHMKLALCLLAGVGVMFAIVAFVALATSTKAGGVITFFVALIASGLWIGWMVYDDQFGGGK